MHERYRRQTDGRTTTYSEREREFTFAENQSWNLRKKNSLANVVGRSGEKQAGETRLQLIFNCGEWTLPTVSYQCCTVTKTILQRKWINDNHNFYSHLLCMCMKLHNNSQTSSHKPSQLHGIYWFKKNPHINIQQTVFLKQTIAHWLTLSSLKHSGTSWHGKALPCQRVILGWYRTAAVKLLWKHIN